MSEKDAEELLQGSMDQKRHNTEPTTADVDDTPGIEDAIRDAFAAIDQGDAPSNVTVRDENLAAVLRGLDNADELERVSQGARDELGRSGVEDANRSQTVGDLVRVGLSVVAPDVLETGKDARERYVHEKAANEEI